MKHSEDGYILASALAVLLAISIVAAALVSGSVSSLLQVVRAEKTAHQETALRSAVSLVTAQLSVEPARRQLALSENFLVAVSDEDVAVRIRWETAKLDLNRATLEAIETRLEDAEIASDIVELTLAAVRRNKEQKTPLRLLDDLGLDRESEACVASLLTVFGGVDTYASYRRLNDTTIGQPAAGSRLAIDLSIEDRIGLSVVVLMTSDRLATFRVLDWRETNGSSGDECNVARNHA